VKEVIGYTILERFTNEFRILQQPRNAPIVFPIALKPLAGVVLLLLNPPVLRAVNPDVDTDLETETEKDLAAGSATVIRDAVVKEVNAVDSKTVPVTLTGLEVLSKSEATLVCLAVDF